MFLNKWALGAVGAVSLGLAGLLGVQVAQQQPAPAPAAATTEASPALWVVKDDDTTIYLFGTVHVLRPGLSWFDDAVRKAFDDSDEVVLELVMPEASAMQAAVMKHAVNASGTPLSQQVPADKREAYTQALAKFGMPATALDTYQPWFAATQMSVLTLTTSGYDANSGAEKVITQAATEAGKPVSGLETVDEQLGFFSGLSSQSQIALLASTIDELPNATKLTDDMVAKWAAGDPQGLGELMNESLRETPELSKVLLADRNARWAEWIEARMAKPGTVFIAVGAGHLAGNDSVQTMLAGRKLTATRVDY